MTIRANPEQTAYTVGFKNASWLLARNYTTAIHQLAEGVWMTNVSRDDATSILTLESQYSTGDHGLAAVWTGTFASGSPAGSHAFERMFDADLSPRDVDRSIFDPNAFWSERHPDIAVSNADGTILAVAERKYTSWDSSRIYLRRLQPDGTPVGTPVRVSNLSWSSSHSELRPAIATFYTYEQRYVVVWVDTDSDASDHQSILWARVFHGDGTPVASAPTILNVLWSTVGVAETYQVDAWATGGGMFGAGAGIVVTASHKLQTTGQASPNYHGNIWTLDVDGQWIDVTGVGKLLLDRDVWNLVVTGTTWSPGPPLAVPYYLVSWWQKDPGADHARPLTRLYTGVGAINPVGPAPIEFSPSSMPEETTWLQDEGLAETHIGSGLFRRCPHDLRASLVWVTALPSLGRHEVRREVLVVQSEETAAAPSGDSGIEDRTVADPAVAAWLSADGRTPSCEGAPICWNTPPFYDWRTSEW